MPIQFTCPLCGAQTEVADHYAGQSGPCAECGQTVTVPAMGAPAGYAPPPRSSSSTPVLAVVVVAAVVAVLGVVVVCGGVLVALLLPAVQSAREAARRVQCSNNLKQISLALLVYQETNGCFPPAYVTDEEGKPLYSWRVLILPYLEQEFLYEAWDFDEPWDSPANQMVVDTPIPLYHCPSEPGSIQSGETSYVMITGPETIADEDSAIRPADIMDGMSNTILVIEMANSGIHWAEPRDLSLAELSLQLNDGSLEGIRSHHAGGVNAALCDGSVHFLSDSIDPEMLRRLIHRNDAMPIDASEF